MQRVFVSRRIPKVGLDRLQAHFEVDVWPDELPPSREELIRRGIGCSGLLTLLSDTIDGSVMDALSPSLKAIANFAVGYNNIDVKAARQRGIAVGNTPDVLTDATADIAVGLLLSAARQFQASIDQVRQLQWRTWDPWACSAMSWPERRSASSEWGALDTPSLGGSTEAGIWTCSTPRGPRRRTRNET